MQFTLEKYKIFPYVAWTLIIVFAIFTLNLTLKVNNELQAIGQQTTELETY